MPGSTKPRSPSVQAPPDTPPIAGQPQAPPFFGILVVAGLVVVGVGLKSTASIVGPVFLVLTIVITVTPLRRFLVKHRWPSALASLVSLLVIYVVLIVILGSVVWSVYKLVAQLPTYATAFQSIFNSLLRLAQRLGVGESQITSLASQFQLSSLAAPAQSLLSAITGFGSILVLIVAVVIFMAFDQGEIGERLTTIRSSRPHIADGLQNFADRVRKYWIVTTVFGLIVAVLDYVGLMIIGVPLAFTWGVLAFVTNYIPNVGFVIGVIPPALIALLDGGVGSAIAVVIVYAALNVIVQTIIQPRFTGDAVGISATAAFVSLIFWAYLLGSIGALVAIPATLFLKSTLLDNSTSGSWVSALISSDPGRDKPKQPVELSPRQARKQARRRAKTRAKEQAAAKGPSS